MGCRSFCSNSYFLSKCMLKQNSDMAHTLCTNWSFNAAAGLGVCVVLFTAELQQWIVEEILVLEADSFTNPGNVLRRCMSINAAGAGRDARYDQFTAEVLRTTACSAKRVLAIVILSVHLSACLSLRPSWSGSDSSLSEIETPDFYHMIASVEPLVSCEPISCPWVRFPSNEGIKEG